MANVPIFKRGEQAQAIRHASRSAAPFLSHLGTPYLSIPAESNGQTTIPIRSRQTELWMIAQFMAVHECPPSDWAMRTARKALEAEALHQGPRRAVGRRLLAPSGNTVVLDLGPGASVEITARGWDVTSTFHAFERDLVNPASLPVPSTDGNASLAPLRSLLHIEDEPSWDNIVTWLTNTLRPAGPYPILVLDGPTGSGKSVAANILKSVIDPGPANVPTSFIRIFDSGARLPRDLAETSEKQPTILIRSAAHLPPHIARRAIVVTLKEITQQRAIRELRQEFLAIHSQILAALCDATVRALAQIHEMAKETYARLADTYAWSKAATFQPPDSEGPARASPRK